ncbi:hypothetical protein BC936DRAFT_137849, partial [Jimgerdemannia flammicorona]
MRDCESTPYSLERQYPNARPVYFLLFFRCIFTTGCRNFDTSTIHGSKPPQRIAMTEKGKQSNKTT